MGLYEKNFQQVEKDVAVRKEQFQDFILPFCLCLSSVLIPTTISQLAPHAGCPARYWVPKVADPVHFSSKNYKYLFNGFAQACSRLLAAKVSWEDSEHALLAFSLCSPPCTRLMAIDGSCFSPIELPDFGKAQETLLLAGARGGWVIQVTPKVPRPAASPMCRGAVLMLRVQDPQCLCSTAFLLVFRSVSAIVHEC
jgi:hypothetical protein